MDVKQIERLEALLALPGFPFGGPMFASDLCEFDEDGDPVPGSWDLESREIIAACVNFMCANGPALLQLARAVNEAATGEVIEIGDDDTGQPRVLIHSTRDELRKGPPLPFKTVALVPVLVKEGA